MFSMTAACRERCQGLWVVEGWSYISTWTPLTPRPQPAGHPRLLVTQATPLLDLPAGVVSQHVLGVCRIRPLRNKTELASAKLRAGEERSQNSQVNGPSARRQEEFALEVTNPLTKGISGPSRWPGGWSVGPDAKKGHQPSTRDPGPQIQWTVPMHSLSKASKKWKESSIQTDSWKWSREVAT